MLDFGEHKFTATTLTKVGEATAAVLLRPEETKNQYVQVSSFTLTQRLVRETLEKKSGGKFYMNEMTVAELFAVAKKYQEEGDKQGAYHRLVTAFVCSGNEGVCFPEKARHWNKVLGLDQKETLDEVIERVLVNVSNTENRS